MNKKIDYVLVLTITMSSYGMASQYPVEAFMRQFMRYGHMHHELHAREEQQRDSDNMEKALMCSQLSVPTGVLAGLAFRLEWPLAVGASLSAAGVGFLACGCYYCVKGNGHKKLYECCCKRSRESRQDSAVPESLMMVPPTNAETELESLQVNDVSQEL